MQSFSNHVVAISYFREKGSSLGLSELELLQRKVKELRGKAIIRAEKKEVDELLLEIEDLIRTKSSAAEPETEPEVVMNERKLDVLPSLFVDVSIFDFERGNLMEEIEREAISKILHFHKGNRSKTARTLGLSVRTVRNKIKNFAIQDGEHPTHTAV